MNDFIPWPYCERCEVEDEIEYVGDFSLYLCGQCRADQYSDAGRPDWELLSEASEFERDYRKENG